MSIYSYSFLRRKTLKPKNIPKPVLLNNYLSFHELYSIKKSVFLSEKKDEYIESENFSPKGYDSWKWRLRVYPSGEMDSDDDCIALYLKLISAPDKECHAKCEVIVIGQKNKIVFSKEFEDFHWFISNGKGWGFKNFISRAKLFKSNSKYIQNDHLNILCKVKLELKMYGRNLSVTTFGNGTETDVILYANGEEFEVHKNILAARSQVFASLFQSAKYIEDGKIRVDVNDVDPRELRDLIRAIYLATADDMVESDYLFRTDIARKFAVS